MLKLGTEAIEKGIRITLREKWHDKLLSFSKNKKYPYDYTLMDVVKQNKETYYICICENDKKKCRIAMTDFVIRYLLAKEVPDSNMGLGFKEYLPLEDTHLLVTNMRNPSSVVPAILRLECELVEIADESYIVLDFKLDFTNGKGFTGIRYYAEGSRKSTWKFVFNNDESYMSEYEMQFRDTIIHKEYVKKSAEKLARYLEKQGAINHAELLRQRAIVHDDSKMSCEDELHALARIIMDKSTLKDPTKQLSQIKKDAIELHWKHNSHHPEHFKTPEDMERIDVMEMCCDWHARSTQYKTNLMEFMKTQNEIRFHFPSWMFHEIEHYCEVLLADV